MKLLRSLWTPSLSLYFLFTNWLLLINLFYTNRLYASSAEHSFDQVCADQPTIKGDRHRGVDRTAIADQPAYFIDTIQDPLYNVRYSIKPDRNARRGSIPNIRAAVLRATNRNNQIVGNWDTLQGPFREQYCSMLNGSNRLDSSVAVLDGDSYQVQSLEAAWVPPTGRTEATYIGGFVYDSRKQIHRLTAVPATTSNGWNVDRFPSLEECGSTKGCYLVPPNCAVHNCLYALTWRTQGDQVTFEMMGKADGWVGVGFSRDKVSFDDFTVCMRENDDRVVHRIVHFSGSHNQQADALEIEHELSENNKRHRGVYSNGRIYCTFTKSKRTNVGPMHQYNWLANLNQPHYIIATYGNRGDIVGNTPFIYKPENRPIVSHSRINFNKEAYPQRGYPAGSWLAKIFLILMLIAWVLLASVAILTSRYYRPIWNSQAHQYGKKSWLTIHQPLTISVAVLTVISFIFLFFEVNWMWPHYGTQFWLALLGVIVLVFSIINAALVLCVPKRYGRPYCIWFWTHWFVSSLAHCLAIPVIFLAMDLPRLDLWDWCSWLLLAWCIMHIITDLILEIHYCMTYRRSYERFEELDAKNRKSSRRYPPGYQWKPFCLGFYIVVTSAVVLTLIIAIIVYD